MQALNSTDFYKTSHGAMMEDGTNLIYSNFTPRSSRLAQVIRDQYDDCIVWFGLQGFLKEVFMKEWRNDFFGAPKEYAVERYERRMDTSLGPGKVTVEHIEALHDLGYLPLVIKSLPEGARVPIKVPAFTIFNTNPDFPWLTNYVETLLSCELWKPSTTATIAFEYKKLLMEYAVKTGTPEEFVVVQGHDFSARGMSGMHDAATSGGGHLLSFIGTDTIPAIDRMEQYYNANADEEMIGCSVPATEHMVMCLGQKDTEINTFKRLIKDDYPTGIISIVSDTWDLFKVITEYTVELKDDILARQPDEWGLCKTVFRPDSGDPADILCGIEVKSLTNPPEDFETWKEWVAEVMDDKFREELDAEDPHYLDEAMYRFGDKVYKVTYEPDLNRHDKTYYYVDNWGSTVSKCNFTEVELTPQQKGAVECLWEVFGGTETEKGYKMLNDKVGLIYGDSITLERAKDIMERLEAKGFASGNVVFGIGSYTYQYVTRDTFGFAMKATYAEVNGMPRELFKDPITDSGVKKSAKGLLRVELDNGKYVMYDQQDWYGESHGELKEVFRNGQLVKETSLQEIRDRLNSYL